MRVGNLAEAAQSNLPARGRRGLVGYWEVKRREGGAVTGVNDDAPDRGAVATDPLCGTVHCYEDMQVSA